MVHMILLGDNDYIDDDDRDGDDIVRCGGDDDVDGYDDGDVDDDEDIDGDDEDDGFG